MSLQIMLKDKRLEILKRCRESMAEAMGMPLTAKLDEGINTIFDQLTEVISRSHGDDSLSDRQSIVKEVFVELTSYKFAQESFHQGYTISQLVRGYGSICQGVTEYALESGEKITSAEFAQLNLSLDIAISQAVEEFQRLSLGSASKEERQNSGYLAHELRNCLTSAMMSHDLMRMGLVGSGGSTSRIVTNSLVQMRELIDRAVAETRMATKHEMSPTIFKLSSLVSEVESSLVFEASAKYISILVDTEPNVDVKSDRHLLISAVTNIVHNAIKYSRSGGKIWIRAYLDGNCAVLEIEDQAGGLSEEKILEVTTPGVKHANTMSTLGLGLRIVRRVADICGFVISAKNLPVRGCIFGIRMPVFVDDLPHR